MADKLRIGFIIGAHEYDSYHMTEMLNAMEDIQFYPMLLRNYIYNVGGCNDPMDGFVFFSFEQKNDDPDETCGNGTAQPKDTLYNLGADGKGLVLLHHFLTSHLGCEAVDEAIGIPNRTFYYDSELQGDQHRPYDYKHDETMNIHVEPVDHPITRGITDFTLIDETYRLPVPSDREEILLTTDNELSCPAIMWTRKQQNSREVCFCLGHDREAYTNDSFRELLHRSILWSCGKL